MGVESPVSVIPPLATRSALRHVSGPRARSSPIFRARYRGRARHGHPILRYALPSLRIPEAVQLIIRSARCTRRPAACRVRDSTWATLAWIVERAATLNPSVGSSGSGHRVASSWPPAPGTNCPVICSHPYERASRRRPIRSTSPSSSRRPRTGCSRFSIRSTCLVAGGHRGTALSRGPRLASSAGRLAPLLGVRAAP